MPLRDHFRPPIWTKSSWEGFYGGWPMTMVQRLVKHLPEDFTAEPRVHLGALFEIDVCAYEDDESKMLSVSEDSGGVATAVWTAPAPTSIAELELADQYEYEVLVYDQSRGRQLVAAVEIVSPANKDRPENRRAFVAKCAALLQKRVCVSIVDLVTTRHFNLYAELMELAGQPDPAFELTTPNTYAVTCRGLKVGGRSRFEVWAYPMIVGQHLPTLPIWLTDDLCVPLELELSYDDTCKVLRLPE